MTSIRVIKHKLTSMRLALGFAELGTSPFMATDTSGVESSSSSLSVASKVSASASTTATQSPSQDTINRQALVDASDPDVTSSLIEYAPDPAELSAFLSETSLQMDELAALEAQSLVNSLVEDLGLSSDEAAALLRAAEFGRTRPDTSDVDGFLFAYSLQVSPDAQIQLQRRMEPAILARIGRALPVYEARISAWRKERIRRAQAGWATQMIGDVNLSLDLSSSRTTKLRAETLKFARKAWSKIIDKGEAELSPSDLRSALLDAITPVLGEANARLLRTRWQLHGLLSDR